MIKELNKKINKLENRIAVLESTVKKLEDINTILMKSTFK